MPAEARAATVVVSAASSATGTELSLRLPSLDEVFYALTGHGTTDIPTIPGNSDKKKAA